MFTLDQVVPWGRSFDEYRRMFGLADEHLRLEILGCGDGGKLQRRSHAPGRARHVVRPNLQMQL